jgi:HEAT repeat protein
MFTWWNVRRLKSDNGDVRARAKQALVDAKAIKPLIGILGDEKSGPLALEALVAIGKPAAEELVVALGHAEIRTRSLAAIGLATMGDLRSKPALLAALDDPRADQFVTVESIRKLGKLKAAEATAKIGAVLFVEGLGHEAAMALAELGAADELLPAAQKGHTGALRGLAKLADPRAYALILPQLRSSSDTTRKSAAECLAELGDQRAVAELLAAIAELCARIRECRPDHHGFFPDWVSAGRRELAVLVNALAKFKDLSAYDAIGSLLDRERRFVEVALDAGNAAGLYGACDVLAAAAKGLARYGDSDDSATLRSLLILAERGERSGLGGYERTREFWNLRYEIGTALRILDSQLERR